MREKIRRFMQGRYGADQLSRFLTAAGLVLIILNFKPSGLLGEWELSPRNIRALFTKRNKKTAKKEV